VGAERADDAGERDTHERVPPRTGNEDGAQRGRRKGRLCLVSPS
jgi:hypothetical protein